MLLAPLSPPPPSTPKLLEPPKFNPLLSGLSGRSMLTGGDWNFGVVGSSLRVDPSIVVVVLFVVVVVVVPLSQPRSPSLQPVVGTVVVVVVVGFVTVIPPSGSQPRHDRPPGQVDGVPPPTTPTATDVTVPGAAPTVVVVPLTTPTAVDVTVPGATPTGVVIVVPGTTPTVVAEPHPFGPGNPPPGQVLGRRRQLLPER
jgi:hypothetical protein